MVMYNFANEGREGELSPPPRPSSHPGSDAYVDSINQIPLNGKLCVKKKEIFQILKLKYLDFSPLNDTMQLVVKNRIIKNVEYLAVFTEITVEKKYLYITFDKYNYIKY